MGERKSCARIGCGRGKNDTMGKGSKDKRIRGRKHYNGEEKNKINQ